MMPSEGHAGPDLVARAGSLIQHRIQNPLQVIVAEAELLRGSLQDADPEAAESLDAIRSAARRIADSVTHFDDWARDALDHLEGADAARAAAPADPALTGALATELRVLARQVRALGLDAAERLQPRLNRAARLADLWLRSSATKTASIPSLTDAAAVTVASPPPIGAARPATAPASTTAAARPAGTAPGGPTAADPPRTPTPAGRESWMQPPDSTVTRDPRLIALLDRLRRLEHERSSLSEQFRTAREDWHFGVHELRNAAQALTGWLDIVGDTPYADAAWYRPLMQAAEAVLQRAEDALGRVRADVPPRLEVRARTVDLDRIAREALDRIRPLTHGKRLRTALISTPVDRGVTVRADPERTMQILLNLLRNSVTATPPDGAILVCIRAEPDTGIVEVEDTGPGIPADLAEQLSREAREADPHARSGVGLVLSRRLAERMGGSLQIGPASRSSGARMILTLPRDA